MIRSEDVLWLEHVCSYVLGVFISTVMSFTYMNACPALP